MECHQFWKSSSIHSYLYTIPINKYNYQKGGRMNIVATVTRIQIKQLTYSSGKTCKVSENAIKTKFAVQYK